MVGPIANESKRERCFIKNNQADVIEDSYASFKIGDWP